MKKYYFVFTNAPGVDTRIRSIWPEKYARFAIQEVELENYLEVRVAHWGGWGALPDRADTQPLPLKIELEYAESNKKNKK
jgi:hypothetical protein